MPTQDYDFLHWGPHGLYATAVLMLLSIPLGWFYAYTAYVGYGRDVVLPDPGRRRAALGGALIIAVTVLLWRHVLGGDLRQWSVAIQAWAESVMKGMLESGGAFINDRMLHSATIIERFFWVIVSIAYIPALVGLSLFTAIALMLLGLVGGGALLAVGTAAIYAAVAAAATCLPGFLFGLVILSYFLFVRLPLQVVYRRAIREGRWPTTRELVDALQRGTLGKSGWRSNIMAYKAQKFDATLRAEAENLRRTMR